MTFTLPDEVETRYKEMHDADKPCGVACAIVDVRRNGAISADGAWVHEASSNG
jgi:hypothetical protein